MRYFLPEPDGALDAVGCRVNQELIQVFPGAVKMETNFLWQRFDAVAAVEPGVFMWEIAVRGQGRKVTPSFCYGDDGAICGGLQPDFPAIPWRKMLRKGYSQGTGRHKNGTGKIIGIQVGYADRAGQRQ